MNPPDDPPVRQRLRPVSVLECTPGNAGDENGPPITILTLGYRGEVEQPLALSITDTEKLVVECLNSLATAGDEFAISLIDRYFTDEPEVEEDEEPQPQQESTSKPSRPRLLVNEMPKGPVLVLANDPPKIRSMRIHGGYCSDDGIFLLFRWQKYAGALDGILKIESLNRIRIARLRDDELLTPDDWPKFMKLRAGRVFKLASQSWRKMTFAEISSHIRGRKFRLAGLRRKR